MLRFTTAGESHGPAVTVVVEGLPHGVPVDRGAIDAELRRRQAGYGRGGRMSIEDDAVEILSGVRHGRTLGSPVTLLVRNRDHQSWREAMSPDPQRGSQGGPQGPKSPRPGHADLPGAIKYLTRDLRDVLERASARETAARVAAGALVRPLLSRGGIEVRSHVIQIGTACVPPGPSIPWEELAKAEQSPVRCAESGAAARMMVEIDRAQSRGDTVGGVFEVVARGAPVGLGAYSQWDRRLDGRLAQALMSIPSVKAVSLGAGFEAAALLGSCFHDEILHDPIRGLHRPTNRAGGVEAGLTNGEEVRLRAVVKPIPTLVIPLRSVEIDTLAPCPASYERSDTCVVPAAGVVGEAMVAWVLADALIEKVGGDSVSEFAAHLESTLGLSRGLLGPREPPPRS